MATARRSTLLALELVLAVSALVGVIGLAARSAPPSRGATAVTSVGSSAPSSADAPAASLAALATPAPTSKPGRPPSPGIESADLSTVQFWVDEKIGFTFDRRGTTSWHERESADPGLHVFSRCAVFDLCPGPVTVSTSPLGSVALVGLLATSTSTDGTADSTPTPVNVRGRTLDELEASIRKVLKDGAMSRVEVDSVPGLEVSTPNVAILLAIQRSRMVMVTAHESALFVGQSETAQRALLHAFEGGFRFLPGGQTWVEYTVGPVPAMIGAAAPEIWQTRFEPDKPLTIVTRRVLTPHLDIDTQQRITVFTSHDTLDQAVASHIGDGGSVK